MYEKIKLGIRKIKELEGISTEIKEKILGRNALALLGRNL